MANDEKIEGSIVKDVAAQMSYITTVNAFEAVTSGYPVIVTATFIRYILYLLLSAVYVVSYFEPWSKVKIVASMDEPSKFSIAYDSSAFNLANKSTSSPPDSSENCFKKPSCFCLCVL